ncbi:MAG: DUF1592 domain-containing protein [Myxococcota bacterium]
MRCVLPLLLCAACTGTIGDRAEPPSIPDTDLEAFPGQEFACVSDAVPGPNLVRRLTVNEYVATVAGALDVDVSDVAPAEIPPEPPSDGFSNTAATLVVSLAHVEAYEALSETILERVDLTALLDRYAPCRESRCEADTIDALALRLYRAPILPEERNALLPLFAAVREEGGDFEEGTALVLRAMLQSPRFLYRTEVELGDGVRELSGYEMASRLSYLVWGAPPDDELFAAAERNDLRSDEAIIAAIDRMLADPRATLAATTFASEWLDLDRLDLLTRDEERFPEWTPELGRAMKAETTAFVDTILMKDKRPLRDLFGAQFTIASPELAAHYGLPEPDADGFIDLQSVPERGGLLTQGSVLTVGGNESSMVMRGLFLLNTILCLDLDSPPEGVDTTPPEVESGRSQRFYSEVRVEDASCRGCHAQMEPLAWGLEPYDATGIFRTEDEHGNALQQDGSVRFASSAPPVAYASSEELMQVLAGADRVRDCMSLQASRFAMGRKLLASDGCALRDLRERLSTSDGTYRDLLIAIATSSMFRTLQGEEAP